MIDRLYVCRHRIDCRANMPIKCCCSRSSRGVVWGMLQNRAYMGRAAFDIPVPALVSEALFEAVQQQLEENRKHARERHRGAAYLLQG
jgi:hypothetical protein